MSINPKDQCAIHGYEPVPTNYYKICNECWHCFVTQGELIEKDFAVRTEITKKLVELGEPDFSAAVKRAPSGDKVLVCPVCSHDF